MHHLPFAAARPQALRSFGGKGVMVVEALTTMRSQQRVKSVWQVRPFHTLLLEKVSNNVIIQAGSDLITMSTGGFPFNQPSLGRKVPVLGIASGQLIATSREVSSSTREGSVLVTYSSGPCLITISSGHVTTSNISRPVLRAAGGKVPSSGPNSGHFPPNTIQISDKTVNPFGAEMHTYRRFVTFQSGLCPR
ncbi:hypothetical protein AVEN_246216-1 [Araneus ventricosus]|uniref:Uncharacterized protein n=1 Tax=Araneus ventricosus TaxID=182803 RepID=A0A4Y2WQG6_ARAVE|nr:hypothetical protein AVEN_246216-1 [Araneus ventricosus]